jgi:hypothetical protein
LISAFSVRNVSWGYFEFYDPFSRDVNRTAYEDYRKYAQSSR